jgi:hypothetical protein
VGEIFTATQSQAAIVRHRGMRSGTCCPITSILPHLFGERDKIGGSHAALGWFQRSKAS